LETDSRANPDLAINWGVVKSGNEESRYVSSGLKGRDLHAALSELKHTRGTSIPNVRLTLRQAKKMGLA